GREATGKDSYAGSFLQVWQPPDLLVRLSKTGRNPARFPGLHDPTETEGSAGTLRLAITKSTFPICRNSFSLVPLGAAIMRRVLSFALLLFTSWAVGQNCTSYTVVNALDRKTLDDIENLQPDDFVSKVDKAPAPVVSINPDFNNRVLVLLEIDGTK